MNHNSPLTNKQQRNRLLGVLALLAGLALFCGFIGYAWNEPASAAKIVAYGITITPVPTDEGGIIGVIVGGSTTTYTPLPNPTDMVRTLTAAAASPKYSPTPPRDTRACVAWASRPWVR